jgi:hypothetical protein
MNKISTRLVAVAAIGMVVFGGLSMAQSASADQTVGTIQLHSATLDLVTTGPVQTTGSINDSRMFYGITVDHACPTGYTGRSDTLVFQNNVNMGSIATARTAGTNPGYGSTGLLGTNIAMDDTYSSPSPFVNNKALSALSTPLVAGNFEIRVYCSVSSATLDTANDKYFSLPLTLSGTTWAVYTAPVAKTTPTVSLTGQAQADKSVLLTGTVKDGANAATAAVGSVKFVDTTPTTPVTLGSPTAASGVASFTTPVLPVGTYTYTAQFVNNNDPKYGDSLVSGTVTVTVSTNSTLITVGIPGVGAVTLTGVASAVNLGIAALNGGLLTASGTLPSVTVTDTRNLGSSSWSLTGITTDFSTAGGVKLDGKYLGWVPTTTDSVTNAGAIGATVAAGVTGLKTASVLAYGSVVDQKLTTKVGATLNLAAPANTPVGTYNATLTLTLV